MNVLQKNHYIMFQYNLKKEVAQNDAFDEYGIKNMI